MNAWIEHKARRLMIVSALALAVGIPTIACTGGSEDVSSDDDDAAGDDDEKEFDAAESLKGNWKVKPHDDDLRGLRIIDQALKPGGSKEKLKKKLKPPPTADELKMFAELQALPKDSADVKFLQSILKIMKDAKVKIDGKNYVLTVAEDSQTFPYEITDKGDHTAKISITDGPGGDEKHELTWDGEDTIDVKITHPRPQNLVFVRR